MKSARTAIRADQIARRMGRAKRNPSNSLKQMMGFARALPILRAVMAIILRPQHRYPAPNRCIYCNNPNTPLFDEHIIPRNLGGGLVFENASCKRCERTINKEIETPFAEMAGTLRRRTIPVRNRDKKRRPKTYSLHIVDEHGNKTQTHEIPAPDAPRILYLIRFPPVGLFFPETRTEDPILWTWTHLGDLERIKQKYGGTGHVAGAYDLITFSRQLAKIAHSYVAAEHRAIESYEQLLPEFILTGVGDFRNLIGCSDGPLDSDTRRWLCNIHWGRVTDDQYAYLISRIKLFAFTNSPVYEVIVARKLLSLGPLEPVYGRPIPP